MDIEITLSRTTNRQERVMGKNPERKIVDFEAQRKIHGFSGSYKNGWQEHRSSRWNELKMKTMVYVHGEDSRKSFIVTK